MRIRIRKVSEYYQYILDADNITIKSSLLTQTECKEIAKELLHAASELLSCDSKVSAQVHSIEEDV